MSPDILASSNGGSQGLLHFRLSLLYPGVSLSHIKASYPRVVWIPYRRPLSGPPLVPGPWGQWSSFGPRASQLCPSLEHLGTLMPCHQCVTGQSLPLTKGPFDLWRFRWGYCVMREGPQGEHCEEYLHVIIWGQADVRRCNWTRTSGGTCVLRIGYREQSDGTGWSYRQRHRRSWAAAPWQHPWHAA